MESTSKKDRIGNPVLAAVLIPFFEDDGTVLFTVRTDLVEHHKGQISFPGGVFENGDQSLEETALRETEEEIGLDRRLVKVVGELPNIPTVRTNFLVRPYVGVIQGDPALRPNPHEISQILKVPIAHLRNSANVVRETYERGETRVHVNAYHYQGYRIWGATGMMVQVLLEKALLP